MKKLYILFLLIMTFVLHSASRAEALSLELSCNVIPDGTACDSSGIYTLRGVGFVNVSGVEAVIQYDPATLKNPQITKGPMLLAATVMNNANFTASSVKIAAGILPPFLNGTGILATVRFTPAGATPGNVSIQSSKLTSGVSGAKVQATIKNPGDFIAEEAARIAAQRDADAKAAENAKQLTVRSSNLSGVSMTMSSNDNVGNGNGSTPFYRIFSDGASVSVTAPSATGGNFKFTSWEGCNRISGTTCYVTMNGPMTVTAAYVSDTGTKSTDTSSNTDTSKNTDTSSNTDTSKNTDTSTPVTPTQADLDAVARYAAQLRAQAEAAAAAAEAARTNAAGASVSVSGGASAGTITLPSDPLASAERKTEYQPLVTDLRGDMTIPLSGGGSSAQPAADQQPTKEKTRQENRSVSYKSVLQLFREFDGEKSAKALIGLFAEGAVPDFVQVPAVALSDGTTPVRLTLFLKPSSETPKFIFQGASVQQISSEGEERIAWTIDALPKKGVHDAKLTVIDGQVIMEFPLVVAPPIGPLVPKAQKFTDADFTLYLSKPAKFDLNKDAKFDTLDDYIFTANYIAALKIKPEKLKKEESAPGQKGEVRTKDLPEGKKVK